MKSCDIPAQEWSHFEVLVRRFEFIPGQELPRHLTGYVQSGLLRAFYREADGTETTREFAWENEYACYLTLYQNAETEDLVIEALEETIFYAITVAQLEELYQRHPCWEQFGRKITEEAYLKKLRRERQLLSTRLIDRYQQWCLDYPGLVHRVPQYMQASFLGVSPVSLSRIKLNASEDESSTARL